MFHTKCYFTKKHNTPLLSRDKIYNHIHTMHTIDHIIDSIDVRFGKTKAMKIVQDFTIENFYETENVLIFVKTGSAHFFCKKQNKAFRLKKGDIYLIIGGTLTSITYGKKNENIMSNEHFLDNRWQYVQLINDLVYDDQHTNIIYINFDVKIFNAINLFASFNIPSFQLKNAVKMKDILQKITEEKKYEREGYEKIVSNYTEILVIELLRFMFYNQMFVDKLMKKKENLQHPKLIDMFNYINNNLDKKLSNKIIAQIVNVSEDYIGQYFKMLVGINPQDYIEYQRMEKAVHLLRSTKKSIQSIAEEVGFKDTAYFCRRFKMMFSIPASKIRIKNRVI